jgi:hypothetical protein
MPQEQVAPLLMMLDDADPLQDRHNLARLYRRQTTHAATCVLI